MALVNDLLQRFLCINKRIAAVDGVIRRGDSTLSRMYNFSQVNLLRSVLFLVFFLYFLTKQSQFLVKI